MPTWILVLTKWPFSWLLKAQKSSFIYVENLIAFTQPSLRRVNDEKSRIISSSQTIVIG